MSLENLMSAFEQQLGRNDLSAANDTLQQLLKVNPANPQVQIASADFYKAIGRSAQAESIYRDILKSCTQTKLLLQARNGLKEIEDADLQRHQNGIAHAIAAVDGEDLGFLAIHPVPSDRKQDAVASLAKIFRIDPYTAKLQIPSRHLKLLRIGRLGEMQFYGQQMVNLGIPALWISLKAIAAIDLHTVTYFESAPHNSGMCAVCKPKGKDSTPLQVEFNWSEVSQRVHGLLPTYGEVVTVDAKHQLTRKEEILDLVRVCDLHLPAQNCILRFHDNCYQFTSGIQLKVEQSLKHIAPTVEERWQSLISWLSNSMSQVEGKDDFNDFAEMFLAYPDFVKAIDPKIDLFRETECLWDNCFQIYSGTIFKCNL